jgi:hypothetical protein
LHETIVDADTSSNSSVFMYRDLRRFRALFRQGLDTNIDENLR